MNSRQLQYAIELAQTLNFSQVAENRNISQPALSKQILSLEKELGVKLFDRGVPLTLTPAGEHFIREARTLLYKEDQLLRSMEQYRSGKAGQLTVGITPFRSAYLIPPIVRRVRERFPGIRIKLHEAGSAQLRREAAEGKFDFAVVNLPVDEAALSVQPLEPDKLVLVVPTGMMTKTTGEAVAFSECAQLSFVVVGQTQEMGKLFDRLCVAADVSPVIAAEVVGLTTAWAMAAAGVGATLLPMQFVRNTHPSDAVQILELRDAVYFRQPAVITKRGQYLSEAARYAMELLTAAEPKG